MLHDFRVNGRRRFLQPNATGGMGYAIPAALGAKIAFPEVPVFAVLGDGGFAMTMHGLMTAIEANLPIVTIVLNNQALGWVYHGQTAGRTIASEFAPFNHTAIAAAIGCNAVRVSDAGELKEAIPQAVASGVPSVIEVMTTRNDTFRDAIAAMARAR
jgi:acetolactate synthase-1/2/3 large subunit